jgi:hypothetical protein
MEVVMVTVKGETGWRKRRQEKGRRGNGRGKTTKATLKLHITTNLRVHTRPGAREESSYKMRNCQQSARNEKESSC